MTVPGGDSGENAPGGADQTRPEWGTPSSPSGFGPPPAPPAGYQPSAVPPAPGFGVSPGPPPDPAPGYAPPVVPTGYAPPGYRPAAGYPPPGYSPPGGYLPGYYGAAYPGGYAQPSGRTNTLAITSLVISIAGIIFTPLAVVGIVLAVIAFNQIKRSGEGGHGLAVAGVAVGAVTLVVGAILTLSLLQ